MSKVSTPKMMIKEEFIIEDNIIPLKKIKKEDEKDVNLTLQALPKVGRPSSSTGLPGLSDVKPKLINDVNKTKKPCNCTRSQCLKLCVITLILVKVVLIDYCILLLF